MNNKTKNQYSNEQKEIEAVKAKFKYVGKTDKELIIFYLEYFYEFILKSTRMAIIAEIYDYLKTESVNYGYYQENFQDNPDIEKLFVKIANQIYETSKDKHSITNLIATYITILTQTNIPLTHRFIKEIYDLMAQVNRMIQLYYSGDGNGRVMYIHLYEESDKSHDNNWWN